MHTQLTAAAVSAQHAVFGWTERGWTLRDLGSRNGTWLDGELLTPGQDTPVARGAVIQFGSQDERFVLITDAAPAPSAHLGDQVVAGSPDLLPLPSADAPLVLIYWSPGTGWVRAADEQELAVQDGDVLEVGGERWTLSLPEPIMPTVDQRSRVVSAGELALHFQVSADEEHVQVRAVRGAQAQALPPRAHHYFLLTLARARLQDLKQGVSDAEAGWRTSAELSKMLRCSSNQVYVSLHRIKKELETLDFGDGAAIMERRELSRQVRVRAASLVVESG